MRGTTVSILFVKADQNRNCSVFDRLRSLLAEGVVSEQALSLTESYCALQNRSYDLVVLNSSNESIICQFHHELENMAVATPVIVLLDQEDHELGSRALQAGASDYLSAERLTPDYLKRSIRYTLERHRLSEALNACTEVTRQMESNVEASKEGGVTGAAAIALDVTERKRAEEERNSIIRQARCILWSAEVIQREREGESYLDWKMLHFDEEAAQSILPVVVRPGENYAVALWRSRNPEDNQRMHDTSQNAFLTGASSYQQEFRCTDRYGDEHWLSEDVSIQPLGEGRWRAVGVATEITQKKRLEEEFRRSEMQKSAMFQSALDCIVSMDDAGRVIEFNPAAERTFGYTHEEAVGRLLADLIIPPAMREGHRRGLARYMASGEGRLVNNRVEIEAMCADGTEILVELAIVPVRAGERTFFTAHLRDITERTKIASALIQSEMRLRALVESIDEIVFEFDEDGVYVNIWTQNESLLAKTKFELLGMRVTDVLGESIGRPFADAFRQVIATGQAENMEYDLDVLSGKRWFLARISPISAADGSCKTVCMLSRDITERKRSEDERNKVLRHARCILWTAEVTTIPNDPNRYEWKLRPQDEEAAQSIIPLDVPKGGLYSDAWYASRPPEDQLHTDDHGNLALRSGKRSYQQEFRCVDRFGVVHWLFEDVSLESVGEGRWHAVGVCTDVSERKLLESQLAQSQKMESVGRLAGGIAHDFNNILAVIIGFSELILMKMPDEDQNRIKIDQIHRAGRRAADLTNQLLAFSRKQVLASQVIDLGGQIANTSLMLQRLIGEDVHLVTRLAAGKIKADPGQVEQVILNLAVNARDAMPDGGTLTLETMNWELDAPNPTLPILVEPGSYVAFIVTDTGAGMDQMTMDHVFEPFFTTKETGKGTGLGLATVFGVVEQSGGHVWVESSLGDGTRFTLLFPRIDENPVVRPEADSSASSLQMGSETILIVEDEEMVREVITEVLDGCGYHLMVAKNGKEALEILRNTEESIDLILTDVVMPGGVSGPDVAEHARRRQPETRILFMTGYTDDAVIRRGVLTDTMNLIQKPFSPVELAQTVRELLKGPASTENRSK